MTIPMSDGGAPVGQTGSEQRCECGQPSVWWVNVRNSLHIIGCPMYAVSASDANAVLEHLLRTPAAPVAPERLAEDWRAVVVDAAKEWQRCERADDRNTNGILGASFMDWDRIQLRLEHSTLRAAAPVAVAPRTLTVGEDAVGIEPPFDRADYTVRVAVAGTERASTNDLRETLHSVFGSIPYAVMYEIKKLDAALAAPEVKPFCDPHSGNELWVPDPEGTTP